MMRNVPKNSILFALPILFIALLLMMASALLFLSSRENAFPNLIESGNIEHYSPLSKKERWQVVPEEFFSWNTFSHSGKRALCVDASRLHSTDSASISYTLKNIKPEKYYLFEVHLHRDRNVVGVYPAVSLFGQEQRLSDFWAQNRWQKLSLFFKSHSDVFAGAAQTLKVVVPGDNYKLWVDDLSLREFNVQLIEPKEGTRIKEEQITFSWKVPETDRLLGIKIILSPNDYFGEGVVELRTDNRKKVFSVPNSLEQGKWFWRVEVYQYNKLISVSERRSFIVEKTYKAEVSPKARKAEVIHPDFFPIGIYNATVADFKELSEAGFNSVHASFKDYDELNTLLESAHKHSLKVLVPFPEDISKSSLREIAQQEAPGISSIQPDPVLGWYLDDEPEGRSASPKNILQRLETLRTNGFSQPGAIALCRSWRTIDYIQATDVVMSDPYPIPFNPLSWLSGCLDEIHSVIKDDPAKRVWAVIQAFGWNSSSPTVRKTGLGREPTPQEVKAMTYLSLTHRAHGLFYYSYRTGRYLIKESRALWEGVKDTVREMNEVYPLLLSPEFEEEVMCECHAKDEWGIPAVHFIGKVLDAKETKGKRASLPWGVYLIAVNTLGQPVSARFSLKNESPGKIHQAYDVFSRREISLSGLSFRLDFAPFERKVLFLGRSAIKSKMKEFK